MVQRGSAQLLALTAPQEETKLRTSLYPTDVYYLHSPETSLCCSRQGEHTLTGKDLTGIQRVVDITSQRRDPTGVGGPQESWLGWGLYPERAAPGPLASCCSRETVNYARRFRGSSKLGGRCQSARQLCGRQRYKFQR